MNILVIYNGNSMFTPTVQDYVGSFQRFSRFNVHYLHTTSSSTYDFEWGRYDVVAITYSCRLCYLDSWSPQLIDAIRRFKGLKVAFPQDEYQETDKIREAIRLFGIAVVFTCVPEDRIEWVYPAAVTPGVRYVRVLTGYVPERLSRLPRSEFVPTAQRSAYIGYRGRSLGHCWGDLANFKFEIGVRFKEACERRSIPCDIEWTEDKRIYQDQWYDFIASSRVTLGSPSGLNVFDFDGSLEREYWQTVAEKPDITYAEYRPRIAAKEEEIDMGQASPRLFEAVALRTGLVLLEGSYSGVVEPDVTCIVVRRDWSNIDEVLDKVCDTTLIERMTDIAYERIIRSGQWTYERFIGLVDDVIEEEWESGRAPSGHHPAVSTVEYVKAADQSLLESYALASTAQFPMTRWLDLSHLRSDPPDHKALQATMKTWLAPSGVETVKATLASASVATRRRNRLGLRRVRRLLGRRFRS